jgi:hypothetical protein
MIIYLPDPVAAQVLGFDDGRVMLKIRDAAHQAAFDALLEKAMQGGYAVEIRLIHYEGHPDRIEQAKARKAKKARSQEGLEI